jgi:chromosome segregation ATPase
VGTLSGIAQERFEDNVPISYRIKQARNMIKELTPEIEHNTRRVARQQVDVTRLEGQLADVNGTLEKSGGEVQRLKADLEQGGSIFVYAGKNYTETQVRDDLTRRFDRFKTQKGTADKLDQLLHARKVSLSAAREKVKAMQGAKEQLKVDVANLEARMQLVEVNEATKNIHIDDSQLARVREMVDTIETRISVAEQLVNSDPSSVVDEIQLDSPESRDILDEVTAYFGNANPDENAIVLD